MASIVGFPDPVDEVSARLVAAGVVVLSLLTVTLDQPWLTAVIAYGFLARVVTGPTLSPLGLLVTRVVRPRLAVVARPVPGPPKRFAQAMGAAFSLTAAILALGFGLVGPAYVVLALLTIAATLEAAFAFCLGCRVFGLLMRVGVIPDAICDRCTDLRLGSA
jgi:Domain of unknown function (DUF4395)